MYCCVFIKFLQERIVAVQNSNIRDLSCWKVRGPIVLEICPTPNPTLSLPDNVDKRKTDVFIDVTVLFELLYMQI